MVVNLRRAVFALVVAAAFALPIQAHTFNHLMGDQNRHSVCEVYEDPNTHYVGDGHAHVHTPEDAIAQGYHRHDPCDQSGMAWKDWPDAGPLTQTYYEDAILNLDDPLSSRIITDFEGFLSDILEFQQHHNLIFVGDASLDAYAAAGGMPGSGTKEDPYILEGRFIRNALLIKDTSKCIVIRDNIVHSRALIGPIFGPDDIVEIPSIVQTLEHVVEQTTVDLGAAQDAGDSAEIERLEALLQEQEAELAVASEKVETGFVYEALGVVAETEEQLARDIAQLLRDALNRLAGRMILDWNGQCVHVYNNIVEDLRVNQNNARAGYATGGLIENNRLYHIGQIRHYDGEFRENVVGYPEHLRGWLPGDEFSPIPSFVTMNTDGFNQGWFHDNTFFGSVDLDYHGHHHGAGFFSPESHYHGLIETEAYMVAPDGTCLAESHHSHMGSNLDISVQGLLSGHEDNCLPHHNHHMRWTSATFEDNVVIDPYGYGIRYEDRNHKGDDRYANSETMRELDAPHFHRSFIQVRDNVVLGSLWVDLFNSPTVDVWSDDYSEVRRDLAGMIIDAVDHLGAEPLPSHPQRNNGWFEMTGNTVFTWDKLHNTRGFHYGWAAYQLNHIWEADDFRFDANSAYLIPHTITTQADADTFLTELLAAADAPPDTAAATVAGWGTERPDGPVTFGLAVHHLEDSYLGVCGNAMRGFDASVLAWNGIYEDATVDICESNDFDSPSYVRYWPLPAEREPGLTAPIRGLTDDSSLEPLADYLLAPIERQEDGARNTQAWVEAWADAQVANIERHANMQVDNINRFMATQAAWADRTSQHYAAWSQNTVNNQAAWADRTIAAWQATAERTINNQQYWAEHQAAQREAWADYQLTYYMSQADYRAAQAMGYVEWAEMMADQYTHAVPV